MQSMRFFQDALRPGVAVLAVPGEGAAAPAAPAAPSVARMRRDSVRSIASSAADDVRSELMDVIAGLKLEVETLRQAQEQQSLAKTKRKRRLSLASLRMI